MTNNASVDPALVAARDVARAEMDFLAVHEATTSEGVNPRFTAAELHWERAEESFADAVPTTLAGALAKLHAVRDMLRAVPMPDNSLEIRHVEGLCAFVESLEASAGEGRAADVELMRHCA